MLLGLYGFKTGLSTPTCTKLTCKTMQGLCTFQRGWGWLSGLKHVKNNQFPNRKVIKYKIGCGHGGKRGTPTCLQTFKDTNVFQNRCEILNSEFIATVVWCE